jgi:hypothetical protein
MNAFFEHHKDSIQFAYRCFDRILLNGLIQPFQQPERVLGFFNTYREGKRVTKRTLTEIADQFQYWLKNRSQKWGAPILDAPEGEDDESRRNRFVEPYYQSRPTQPCGGDPQSAGTRPYPHCHWRQGERQSPSGV